MSTFHYLTRTGSNDKISRQPSRRLSKEISSTDERILMRTTMNTLQSIIMQHEQVPDEFIDYIQLKMIQSNKITFSHEKLKKFLVKLNLELKKRYYGEEYMFHKNFIRMEVLGSGAFGEVVKVYDDIKKVFYAKKTIKKQSSKKGLDFNVIVIGEIIPIIHLTNLNDADLLKIVKIDYEQDKFLDIYMEYGIGTLINIADYMKNNNVSYPNFIQEMSEDLNIQLNKLSAANLCHRDVKPENIIITNDYKFKLADFGCCEKILRRNEQELVVKGTPAYMLPELKTALDKKEEKCRFDPFDADKYAVKVTCSEISAKITDIKNLKKREQIMDEFDSDMKYQIYKRTGDPKKRMEILSFLFKNKLYDEIIAKLKVELKEPLLETDIKINHLQKLGEVHHLEGHFDDSIHYYQEAIYHISRSDMKKSAIGPLYLTLAQIYLETKNYKEAISYLETGIKSNYAYNQESTLEKAEFYDLLGLIQAKQGNFKEALENNKIANDLKMKYSEETSAEIAKSISNLGLIYLYHGKPNDALENMNKAYGLRQRIFTDENNADIADSYDKFAEYYCKAEHIEKIKSSLRLSFQEGGKPKIIVNLDPWSDVKKSYDYREKSVKIKENIVYRKTLMNEYENLDFLKCYICQEKIDQTLTPKMKNIELNWLTSEGMIEYYEKLLSLAVCSPYVGEMEIREADLTIDLALFDKMGMSRLNSASKYTPVENAAWFRLVNYLHLYLDSYSSTAVDVALHELEIIYKNNQMFIQKDYLISNCRQRIFEAIIKTKIQDERNKSSTKFISFLERHSSDHAFENQQIAALLTFLYQATEIAVGFCKKRIEEVIAKHGKYHESLPFFYFLLCFGYHGLFSKSYVHREKEDIDLILNYGKKYLEVAKIHYNNGNILTIFILIILLYHNSDVKESLRYIIDFKLCKFSAYEEPLVFSQVYKCLIDPKEKSEFITKLLSSVSKKNQPEYYTLLGICDLLEYPDSEKKSQSNQYLEGVLNHCMSDYDLNDSPNVETHEKLIEIYELLGIKYMYMEKYEDAFDHFFNAYVLKKEIYKEKDDSNIDSYITSYSYLATAVRYKGGSYKLEIDYRLKIIDYTVSKYGDNHLKSAEAYENLAIFHYRNKNYNDCIDNLRRSYLIKVKKLGFFHLDLYKTYKYFIDCYTEMEQKSHSKYELEKWMILSEIYHSFFEGIKIKKSFEQRNYIFDDQLNLKMLSNLRRYNFELHTNEKYVSKTIRIVEKLLAVHTSEGIEADLNLHSQNAKRNDVFNKLFSHIQKVLKKNPENFEESLRGFIQEIIENHDKVSDLEDVLNFFALYAEKIVMKERYYKDIRNKITQEIKHPIFGIILYAIGLGYRKNGKFIESKSYLQMSKSAFLENEIMFREEIDKINTLLSSLEVQINPRNAIEDRLLDKQEYDEYDILLSEQHIIQGMYLTLIRKYEESIEIYKTALNTLYENNSYEFEIKKAYVYDFIGINYYFMESYNQAVNYHNQGLVVKKRNLDNKLVVNNYSITPSSINTKDFDAKQLELSITLGYDFLRMNYNKLGEKTHAEEYAKKASEIRLKHLTERKFDITIYYASFDFITERADITEHFITKLLSEVETKLKTKVFVLPCLGELHLKLKNYDKAFDYFDKVLIHGHETYKNDLNHFTVYENIASYSFSVSNFEKAYDCLITALKFKKAIFGDRHLEIAVSLRRLGIVSYHLRKFEEALIYHKQSLQIITEVYKGQAAYEEQRIICFDFIGINHYALGNLEKAMNYHEETLSAKSKLYGDDYTLTADSYEYVGRVYFQRREYQEAIDHYSKAVEIRKRDLGELSPRYLLTYKKLIEAKLENGSIKEVYDNSKVLIGLESRNYGEYSIESYDSIQLYIKSMILLGEYDSAYEYAEKVLHIYEARNIDPFDIEVLIIEIFAKRGQLGISCKRAKELLKRCQTLKPFDIQIAQAQVVLGKTYLGLDMYKDAISCFEKGLMFKPRSKVEQIAQEAECYRYLHFAHSKDGNLEEANQFADKASKLPKETSQVIHESMSLPFESISLYEFEIFEDNGFRKKKLDQKLQQKLLAMAKLFNTHGFHKREKFYIYKILHYEIPNDTTTNYFTFLKNLHFDDRINSKQFKNYIQSLGDVRKGSVYEDLHLNITDIVEKNYCFQSNCDNVEHYHIVNLAQDIQDALEYVLHDASDYCIKELSDYLYTKSRSFSIFSIDLSGATDLTNLGMQRLSKIIEYYRSLSRISLNFSRCFNIRDEGMNSIARQMNNILNMKYFYLNISYCNKLSELGLRVIYDPLSTMKLLEHLEIDYSNLKNFSNDNLSDLSAIFESLRNLKTLILNMSGCLKLNDDGIISFGANLLQLDRLKTLSLDFSECFNLTDKGITELAQIFAKMKISELKLEFKSCYCISDASWTTFAHAIGNHTEYQNIHLNFADCFKITDDFMKALADSLISQINLQKIWLDFSFCTKISDDGLKNLAKCLYRTKAMSSLSLIFKGCFAICQSGIEFLAKDITDLLSLESLHFDFSECLYIFREGIEKLFTSFIVFKKLQKMHLNFRRCGDISDIEIENLANAVRENHNLIELHLDFYECLEVTDHGFSLLLESIRDLTSIESLHMDFGKNRSLTDQSIAMLTCLEGFERMKKLYLGFKECMSISQYGFDSVISVVSKLEQLVDLQFNLKYCKNVNDDLMLSFVNALTSCTTLTTFKLNFANCKDLTDSAIEMISQSITSLTQIRTLDINLMNCKQIQGSAINLLLKSFEAFRFIQNLALNFKGCSNLLFSDSEDLKSGFIKARTLQNLCLEFSRSRLLLNDDMMIIGATLKHLTKLQNIYIGLESCRNFDEDGLRSLASGLKYCSALISLNLNLKDCSPKLENGMGSVAVMLSYLTNLKELEFKYNSWISKNLWNDMPIFDSQYKFKTLFSALKDLDGLNKLNLEFKTHDMSKKEMKELANSISNLTNLQDLSLNYHGIKNNSSENFMDLTKALCNLQRLQTLKIKIKKTGKLLDDFIFAFCDSIKSPDIRSLTINFQYCISITDHAFADISRKIEDLHCLQDLKIKICEGVRTHLDDKLIGSQIRDIGIKTLVERLQSTQNIRKLELLFPWCSGINGSGLTDFWVCCENFEMIQSLNLSFFVSRNSSESKIKCLTEGLAHLNVIKSLKLTLSENPRNDIKDQDVLSDDMADLFHNIGELFNLTTLELDIFIPDKNGESAEILYESIVSLIKLQVLKLSIQKSEIDDEKAIAFMKGMKELEFLRSLELNFYRCGYMKGKGFEILKELSYLKNIKVLFFECRQIKPETISEISKALESLKYCEIIDFSAAVKDEKDEKAERSLIKTQEKGIDLSHHYKFDTEF